MSKLTKVAVLALLVFAATAFATAQLNVTFLDSENGAAFTFDKAIISDGEEVQVFENVTDISAVVPDEFTFTAVYHVASHSNMFEIPLTLNAGESLDLEIYAVDPNTVLARVRPYLVGKEVGITVNLLWSYSEEDNTLIYTVETDPTGRYAFTDTWVYAATDFSEAEVLNSPNPIPHIYNSREFEHNSHIVAYFWCVNLHDWFRYEGPIVDLNVNTTAVLQVHIPSPRDRVRIAFSKVPEDMKGLGIRRANHKYARVIKEYLLTLRNLDGQDYVPEDFYPQWKIPPETHYILGIEGMPADFVPLEYPLFVPDTVHSIVSDLYPPKLAELIPDTFFVAAENFYANSSYANLVRVPGEFMAVDVATELAFEWWGCFVISDVYTVEHLYAYPDGIELEENTDYLINPAEGYNLVTVRTSPAYEQLVLHYAPVRSLGAEEAEVVPSLQTYLNRSDGTTQIRYTLPQNALVELSVYSADGRKVTTLVNEYKPAGTYTVHWDGTDAQGKRVSAGAYICRLEADGIQAVEKMIRLK